MKRRRLFAQLFAAERAGGLVQIAVPRALQQLVQKDRATGLAESAAGDGLTGNRPISARWGFERLGRASDWTRGLTRPLRGASGNCAVRVPSRCSGSSINVRKNIPEIGHTESADMDDELATDAAGRSVTGHAVWTVGPSSDVAVHIRGVRITDRQGDGPSLAAESARPAVAAVAAIAAGNGPAVVGVGERLECFRPALVGLTPMPKFA